MNFFNFYNKRKHYNQYHEIGVNATEHFQLTSLAHVAQSKFYITTAENGAGDCLNFAVFELKTNKLAFYGSKEWLSYQIEKTKMQIVSTPKSWNKA